MPPNLGGFFMVRSYYPSECHADYFDFERIEALFWFLFISLLDGTVVYLTLDLLKALNLPFESGAFLLLLKAQCLDSLSRWITASSSWKRFCLFVCRALSSIMVICMLTAIRL